MGGGLRDVLGLPVVKKVVKSAQNAEFGKSFRGGLSGLNAKLQLVAAQAGPSDREPLEDQRLKLIEAFQKTSAQIEGIDMSRALPAVQRVISAVATVDVKASAVINGVVAGRAIWVEREAEFDDVMLKIGELEDAGHPKADTLRKLGETIRQRVNSKKYQESVAALDQLRPKLEQIVADQGPAAQARRKIPIPTPIGPIEIPTGEVQKCEIEVVNKTDKTLVLDVNSIDHKRGGGFESLPPSSLGPGKSKKFVATGPNIPLVGCFGEMTWQVDEKTTWRIEWRNPPLDTNIIRKPNGKSELKGENAGLYTAVKPMVGTGNTAPFSFVVHLVGDPEGPVVDDPTDEPTKDDPGKDKPVTPGPGGADAASSCHVTITNNSNVELTLDDQGHDRGDFMTFPAKTLAPGASTSFVSVEVPNAKDADDEGCKGFLVWQVGSPDVTWRVEWDNPEGGKNSASASFSPSNAGFKSLNQIGQGEENVPTAFTISGSGGGVTPPVDTDTGSVAYLVTDAESGQGIETASVTVGSDTLEGHSMGTFVNVPVGDQAYSVSAEGYEGDSGTVTVVKDQAADLQVKLKKSCEGPLQGLTFAVVDSASKEPIAGAEVSVADKADTTSANGLATVELPAGSHGYRVTADGYEAKDGKVNVVEGDNQEELVELVKKRGCKREGLTVLVKDKETGKAIQGAEVTVGDQTDTTGSIGVATVELTVGKHAYEAKAEGYEPESGNVDVVEGDNPELVIELVPKDGGCRQALTVAVLDGETKQPIEGAEVSVGDQGDVTSSNGLATFELPVGSHDYRATANGYQPKDGTVEIIKGDNDELIIELTKGDEPTTTLTIAVTDEETGEPISGASVAVGDTQTGTTDGNGIAEFQVEVGGIPYAVEKEQYEPAESIVEVEAGADYMEIVALKKTGQDKKTTVTFVVTARETGEPIEGASVSASADQTGQTNAAGEVEFQVEAGNVPYMVEKEGFNSNEGTFDIEAGKPHVEYVELEKGEVVDWNPPPESKQPTLRKGDKSADGWVEYLQKLLNKHLGPNTVKVTGVFDSATFTAVKKFQKSTDPPCLVDGIVGNETWSMLRKGEREAVGTDKRKPHTYVEKGAEARWATERNDFVKYDANSDEIWMMAFSVGDTPLDPTTKITVRMARADGSDERAFSVELGKAERTGDGQEYVVQIPQVASRFGNGDLPVAAYFPQELGGDLWEGTVPVSGSKGGGGKGKGGGGKGGTPETGTATLEVHVQDPDGNTSSGITVQVTGGPSPKATELTDTAGIARFDLLPGEYFVNAAYRAHVWQPGHINKDKLVPGEIFVVRLKRMATGQATVSVTREGNPEAGATVSVANSVHAPQKTDADGNAYFALPEGTHQVSAVSADGEWSGSASMTVSADKPGSLSLPLQQSGGEKPQLETTTVVVQIKWAGEGYQPHDLSGYDVIASSGAQGTTDSAGKAVLSNVPLGPTTFGCNNGTNGGSASANVEAGQAMLVTIPVKENKGGENPEADTYRVVIFVVDENSDPIEGATVTLSEGNRSVITAKLGGAVFTNVPDGSYTATATFGSASNSMEVLVQGDNVQDQIRLAIGASGGDDVDNMHIDYPTGRVIVRVVDDVTNEPVNATVVLSGRGTHTGSGSVVTFDKVNSGDYSYTVDSKMYAPFNGGFQLVPGKTVEVQARLHMLIL